MSSGAAGSRYHRPRGRRGHSKTVTAISHTILTAAWKTGELYRDLGADYYTRQDPERTTRRLVRQLEALGHHVTLEAATSRDFPSAAAGLWPRSRNRPQI